MKNEVVAFALSEETSEPVNENTIVECKSGSLTYLRFEACLQWFDRFNRNRRNYGGKCMNEGLQRPHIKELLNSGNFFGEAGHPITENMTRVLTIEPKNISHRITDLDIQDDHVNGTIESLPDGSWGSKMTSLMLTGTRPSFSLRAIAPLIKQQDGTTLIREVPRIITYDWVILPSHPEAYQTDKVPHTIIKDVKASGNSVNESATLLMEQQIVDFLNDYSDNLDMVRSITESGVFSSMNVTSDGKFAIVQEGTTRYAVKIEDKAQMEIRDYMKLL